MDEEEIVEIDDVVKLLSLLLLLLIGEELEEIDATADTFVPTAFVKVVVVVLVKITAVDVDCRIIVVIIVFVVVIVVVVGIFVDVIGVLVVFTPPPTTVEVEVEAVVEGHVLLQDEASNLQHCDGQHSKQFESPSFCMLHEPLSRFGGSGGTIARRRLSVMSSDVSDVAPLNQLISNVRKPK